MTCRSAGLFVFEVSGPFALTGLVARIRLLPRLVRRPARSVLAASVAALFVGPVDLVVG